MLQNKTVNKIISLVIALCLWSFVIIDKDPVDMKEFKDIPVTILNEDNLTHRGLILVGDTDFAIDVKITGKRGIIAKLDRELIKATVDVYGRTVGQDQSIEVGIDVPDTVEGPTKNPKILLSIEELIAVQKPIVVSYDGTFRSNTEPGNVTMQPEQIEVKGAKSLVDQVSYISAEVDADLVTAEGKTVNVEAIPTDAAGQRVEDVTLSSATVDITVKLSSVKEVPLSVQTTGEVSPEYHVTDISTPETVTIKGPRDALAAIEAVTAAAIDLSRVSASADIPLVIDLPEGVELADVSKNAAFSIKIEGTAASGLEIPASQITITGLAAGQTAYANTGTVTVKVTGPEDLVQTLSTTDFSLMVDASELTAGSHTVPVTVKSPKAFQDIAVEPAEIQITINEAA